MKRNQIGRAMGVLLSAWVAGSCLAQSAKPPAVDLKDPTAVKRLLAKLSDQNPVVREQGQRELDALPVSGLHDLLKLADQTPDVEAKARLQGRVEELKDIMALNPTPMNFDFDNLSNRQLETELQRQTPLRFLFSGPAANANRERYSLHAKGIGWNEVIIELSEQHPLAPFIVSTDIELMEPFNGGPAVLSSRGALVSLGYVHYEIRDKDAKEMEELLVPVSVMVDPRAKLLATSDARLAVGFPDSHQRFETSDGPAIFAVHPGVPGWVRLYTFSVPKGLSGPLHITGQVKLTAAVNDERLEIDAAKRLNQEVRFGGQMVQVTQYALAPTSRPGWKSLAITLEARKDPDFVMERVPARSTLLDPVHIEFPDVGESVTATVLDAQGSICGIFHIPGKNPWKGGGTFEGTFVEPLKLVLSRHLPPREITVPFNFKAVPATH